MLKSLHIENYALIRESDIHLGPHFIAITGETGAGKSILLGALGLLLGGRASAAALAESGRKCIVEAQFDVEGLGLEPLFAEADVDYDPLLILRREVLPSGKSRAFANDTPVPLAFLAQLAPRIIDIHSQHQTLTLADASFRLSLLDALAADKTVAADYRKAFRAYQDLKRQLESLTATEAQNRREQDYLQFQLSELTEAHLVEGEQATLEQEAQLLAHAERVGEAMVAAASAIDDESESSVVARLRSARLSLSHIASFHAGADELAARLESSLIELDDILGELQHAASHIAADPQRQQQVEERLALLYRLEKKHGVDDVGGLIALRDELDARLQGMASLDERIKDLMEQVDVAFAAVGRMADRLTQVRTAAADELSQAVMPTLYALGMPKARFGIRLSSTDTFTLEGHDHVALLFNANPGGALREVNEVASGGELSRLMLAIKSVLTSHTQLPTILFDEIDTGISGDVAAAMGRTMQDMAARMQVVAITHLPQIAACAEQHWKVYKQQDEEHTVSMLRELTADERVVEVATLLSSGHPTQAALQTARELMGQATGMDEA